MIIVLDLNVASYVRVLRKWASVSRTLNEAQNLLSAFEQREAIGSEMTAQAEACVRELRDVEPSLNYLHQLAREQILKQDSIDAITARELLAVVRGSMKWDKSDPTSLEVMSRINTFLQK